MEDQRRHWLGIQEKLRANLVTQRILGVLLAILGCRFNLLWMETKLNRASNLNQSQNSHSFRQAAFNLNQTTFWQVHSLVIVTMSPCFLNLSSPAWKTLCFYYDSKRRACLDTYKIEHSETKLGPIQGLQCCILTAENKVSDNTCKPVIDVKDSTWTHNMALQGGISQENMEPSMHHWGGVFSFLFIYLFF